MFAVEYKNEKEMDVSSDEEPYDSDLIDSDVEAELYSVIHHETDNSTLNFENSYHSLNSSNKENASTVFDYKEFSTISNVSFESNQNMLNNNSINSSTVQVIEITDKLSNDKIKESINKKKILNSLKDFTFKRKSDSAFDDTQDYKKQKNNEENTSESKNLINLKSNETVILKSSDDISSEEDDDNDIICIGPINNQKHFETNVSEIIITDSDSNSADSWCFKSPKFNTSTPSSTKTKDQWFVNANDIYRSRRISSRYHESQFMTCSRCNQKGHSFKFCSISKGMKCFICGSNHHSSFRCKSKVCAKCFGIGHDMRECPRELDFCERCQMPGHRKEICPDLWRRFQRTTPKKSQKIWRLSQDRPFFCYNCGLPGHFGALCKGRRMNAPAFPTWPFVLNYKVQNQSQVKPAINVSNEKSTMATQHFPKGKNKKMKVKKTLPDLGNIQQITFPRTPKSGQGKPQNEDNCVEKDSKSREELLKLKSRRQEARKAKRLRKKQRKTMLLQRSIETSKAALQISWENYWNSNS